METTLIPENQKVVNFRLEWLLAAGYKKRNAIKIAESDIDWHVAVDIRKHCEDETLCMRVLFGGR